MPRTLKDDEVAELRAQAAQGVGTDALAVRFGVSQRHVRRLVRGDQREMLSAGQGGAVEAAVRALLDGLELDARGAVLAATALVCAMKVDQLAGASSAASAAALPALARQIGETLRELHGEEIDVVELARRMLAPAVRT